MKATFLIGPEATSEHLERFLQVESSGWKRAAGTAILQSPALVSFYTALARRLEKLGWLQWHFLEAEGRTIAGQFAVKMGHQLTLLKIGYDESYGHCAPENMLFEQTIRHFFGAGDIDEINCLTDMSWHNNWRMEKRPCYDVGFYPRRVFPFLASVLPQKTKSLLRKVPGIRRAYSFFQNLNSRKDRMG